MSQHDILQDLKRLARELGRAPKRDEYFSDLGKFSRRQVMQNFESFTHALVAAGLKDADDVGLATQTQSENHKTPTQAKFKFLPPKITPDIFRRFDVIDLGPIFLRFGNVESLRVIFMPDTHLEHADPYALNCFLEFVHWYQPHVFIIGGDFLDAVGLSHWPSDSLREKRIVPECLKGRELLGLIVGLLPKDCEKIYLEGNHENWIEQFLRSGLNPQLFDGIEQLGLEINLKKLLDLETYGFKLFPLNRIVVMGGAAFSHGLYTSDNHPKTHLVKIKHSFFYGHCHDSKSYEDVSLRGPVVSQSMKCLCDLNPTFLRGAPNNWSHGFGRFEFFPDGIFNHTVESIVNGRMSFNGKVFKA